MKSTHYLLVLAMTLAATPLQASRSYYHELLQIKPVITENSLAFVSASSVADLFTIGHNLNSRNKSINTCLIKIKLPATANPAPQLHCTNIVNWMDKRTIYFTSEVAIDFATQKILNPDKMCRKTRPNNCASMESFAQGFLYFIEDSIHFIKSGETEISYSLNVRTELQLPPMHKYEERMENVFIAQLSDDGQKIYFFRKSHSEWEDNLKSVDNATYYEFHLQKQLMTKHSVSLKSTREFIESIHEFRGAPQFLISQVDFSGAKKTQYLLGHPQLTFNDYEFVRDYSPASNSVYTLKITKAEKYKYSVTLEEKNDAGVVTKTQINL